MLIRICNYFVIIIHNISVCNFQFRLGFILHDKNENIFGYHTNHVQSFKKITIMQKINESILGNLIV